ncbi:MAG: LPP20 family lipoprotein, partial [Bacteroidota bacterium]
FRKSYYKIRFDKTQKAESPKKEKVKSGISKVSEPAEYRSKLEKIQEAIDEKQYGSVKDQFTEKGYKMFQKLIEYGNARIISNSDNTFYKFKDEVMARSMAMSFSFENNHQEFVEDVVFHFNKDKKVESLSFGLSKDALKSIIEKEVWEEVDRMVLINFLEHYKTAYALKRLDYIESIFADDALIITGEVVKVKPKKDSRFQNNEIVRYNRQSKQEYIRNLKYSFQSKEYINIQFEESEVRKGGKGDNIYGVQIKQNYYSSNYGDQGYLFLMADLKDPKEPIIHVRTWQPTKGKRDSTYGLSDF